MIFLATIWLFTIVKANDIIGITIKNHMEELKYDNI